MFDFFSNKRTLSTLESKYNFKKCGTILPEPCHLSDEKRLFQISC